jgi:hypothetical protein
VGNVWVYNNSVHAIYTTVQSFYRQNGHDGDRYLSLPQDIALFKYCGVKPSKKRKLLVELKEILIYKAVSSMRLLERQESSPHACRQRFVFIAIFGGVPAAGMRKSRSPL